MANQVKFKVLADVKDFEEKFGRLNKTITRTGKTLTTFVTLPLLALSAGLIKVASDAEETRNKFEVVFRDVKEEATEWAKSFGESIGRATDEIQEFSAGLGDILKPLGFTTQEAFKLSKSMTALAIDVASFQNRQDKDVIKAFASALTGERESLKTLGIAINEADVKNEAFRLGLARVGEELSKTAKAQATVSLLYKNTEDSQGDAIRTAKSFANQMKQLNASTRNLAVSLGEILLPAVTSLVSNLNDLVKRFSNLDVETKKTILTVLGILAVLPPLLILIGSLGSGISLLTKAVIFSNAKILILGNSIFTLSTALLSIAGIGASAFIGWKIGERIEEITGLGDAITELALKLNIFGNQEAQKALEVETQLNKIAVEKNARFREEQEAKTAFREQELIDEKLHNEKLLELEVALAEQKAVLKNQQKDEEKEQKTQSIAEALTDQNLELEKFITDLEMKRNAILESGNLTVAIEKKIADQITDIKNKQAGNEIAIIRDQLGLEKLFRARKVEDVGKTLNDLASINKDFAKVSQRINLGLAIINTATGVTEALKLPFPLNLAIASIVGAQGAIEIATIASQSFAVGTGNVPSDTVANVHRGEIIVPSTFSEAIRSGQLSLSGGEGGAGGGMTVDLRGSEFNAITQELVEQIFTKASENISNRTLTPLPTG